MGSLATDPRAVNNLLHTLRGEQFRHSQNVIRSRTHLSSTVTHNSPTLPVHFTRPDHSTWYDSNPNKAETLKQTRTWRANALSLIFSHTEPIPNAASDLYVPPLTQLCLQKILSLTSSTEFIENVIPFLPSHLRRDLVRYTAIHSPLSDALLFALYEPEGHADREMIIVGPNATLRDDYFIRSVLSLKDEGGVSDWDSEASMPELLCRFILISSRLAVSTLLTLPPTITHLALIDIPTIIPLHRLPGTCPMLVVLDLSYNVWLNDTSKDPFERVDWGRWSCLRVLGLRECYISDELRTRVNKNRWDDVVIVN